MIFLFNNFEAEASHNPNLYVSAENPTFGNRFSGSMVIEVVVNDITIRDTDEGKGEPDVTINGKDLRMVQATDGQWYAYFANVNKAKIADQTSLNGGVDGQGFDFGVFCSNQTPSSVLGASFSDTNGIALPRESGLGDFTDGTSSFNVCSGSPTATSSIINNVVRSPKPINTNPAIPSGQIGLDKDGWPIIQLYSFDDVVIRYNRGGGTQEVHLDYDESKNISLILDRANYPTNAEVFVTISDMQLNQDPTSRDSWTFNINSSSAVFYQAFDENGNDAANGGSGLVNLASHLSSLDFEKNGLVSMTLGSVAKLKSNDRQPDSFVGDGTNTFSQIVTLVEAEPNSGIFESFDDSDESTIGIRSDAPRGQSATIAYNSKSYSILSGSFTASINMGLSGGSFELGKKQTITLTDSDQNINSGAKDDLDIFRSSAIIPSLQIGNPITLEKSSSVTFYPSSPSLAGGISVSSSIPDKNSDRLIIDTTSITSLTTFKQISINLGITVDQLKSLFIDKDPPETDGTNWINYDLRSFENQLNVKDFSDTSFTFCFGLSDCSVKIIDSGDITSAQGLVQIDDSDVDALNSKSGTVFLLINFTDSPDSTSIGQINSETDTQPIIIDFFSFGQKNNQEVNNAIYRFELEETSANSATFTGTVEYTVTNQLNQFDPNLIKSLGIISDEIKFLVNNRLIDEKGISITYSDLAQVGVDIGVTSKTDIRTHSGIVGLSSTTYRFGQPVIITLNDPDLNQKHDTIESYLTVDDPSSENVDTVGDSSGNILLEVLIKDVRYKRCTINGVEHGGLASTGFTLTETGPSTGVFEGVFKMPSRICDKTGTHLISPAGGSVELRYHDFRDASGNQNIITTGRLGSSLNQGISPTIPDKKFILPRSGETTAVTLTGKVANYKQGSTINVIIVNPDKTTSEHTLYATKDGNYKAVMTLSKNSILGKYVISVNYQGIHQGQVSFDVVKHVVPNWIKNNAKWWAEGSIADDEFIKGIEHLINQDIIIIPKTIPATAEQNVPDWIKNTASWWSKDLISDDEFVSALEFLIKIGIIRV